tara:strand:+ start:61 stop:1980 length:1920 start_codon:yes stop_codon:yes gene_type:complete
MATMWDIQYIEERTPQEIEMQRQERIKKNKEYFASGNNFRDPNHAVHYARLQGVENIDGDVEFYRGNKGDGNMNIDYYIRAAKTLGLTVDQARTVSLRGAESGSGRTRDNMVRQFRDLNFGTSEQEKYEANRVLAKKVTAASYARMDSTELAYYQQMPEAISFAREQVKTVDPTFTALDPPDAVSISINQITENSASVNWSPNSQGASSISGYHYVLKNNSTGQTIKESDLPSGQRNSLEQNLVKGNSYTAFIIAKSQYGNSQEASDSFRTLGINVIEEERRLSEEARVQRELDRELQAIQQEKIIEESASLGFSLDGTVYPIQTPEEFIGPPQPQMIPEGFHTMPDGSIMADSEMDKPVLPTIQFPVASAFEDTVATPIIEEVIIEDPVIDYSTIPTITKEYNVNTYRVNEFGGIYNIIISGIDGNRLVQLESEFLVTLVGSPTPSDQEVKDFYNYIDVDTSVKPTMIEQRFLSFRLKDGKVQGKINFIATQFFTDYWKNKTIYSIIKIEDSNGNIILLGNEPKQSQKVNELKFRQDTFEQISINEYVGDIPAVKITAYVWDKINLNSNPQAFSGVRTLDVVIDDPDGKTCPVGYHLGFNGKCVPDGGTEQGESSILGKALGFTALLGALALLGGKRR